MASAPPRLAQLDWMRGLACVLMFQTHCYDAWLAPAARNTTFFMWSQILGTLPAPLFLFLTGVSAALVAQKASRGGEVNLAAGRLVRRGFEVWGLGLLFRLQEYAIAFPWAPWTDLLRVDVLNCLGLSLVVIGCICRFSRTWTDFAWKSGLTALIVSALTPIVWGHRIHWLPWPIESYLSGVHNLGKPAPWLFPIFPWIAFALSGVVVGWFLLSQTARRFEDAMVPMTALVGLALSGIGYGLDHLPWQLYRNYDFWHTSPNFFLIRLGILLIILSCCEARTRLRPVFTRWRPLNLLGQHSLLVYWVHIEFVYGRLHVLPRQAVGIGGATLGLLGITSAMVLLALAKQQWDRKSREKARLRAQPAGASA